ncbi:MAG: DUF2298 domain-containing protein [Anaerolineae bacterium]
MFDWLAREGWIVVNWWLLVTLAGLAALPLCTRLLGALPDKGYTPARAAGLLLVGYVFWILGSLGFLRNTAGSIILSWLIVLGIALAAYFSGQRLNWRDWWRSNRTAVIIGEILFLVLLFGWALVRAHLPDLRTTEKPMDLMFLSSIMRSPTFPPNDGWMAGYSISYYYFGYFISAMLGTISNISSTYAYSMTAALVVALTGLTSFGVVYNLVRSRTRVPSDEGNGDGQAAGSRWAVAAGLVGMLMIVFMGNFQLALIEIPFETRTAPESYLSLTGTQEREVYPEREAARASGVADDQPVTLTPPTQWGYWWWFRASRVLNDYDLQGQVMPNWYAQPIDEFPQFSFVLGDNHPHVTALPYVLLVLGLALNVLLKGTFPNRAEIAFYSLAIGALIFFNTWDGPIYLIALVGADGLRRLVRGQGRLEWRDGLQMAGLGALLLVLALLFYLPFLISFRSQASGLLPNVITPTFFSHFFIMFGPFILLLGVYLIMEARRAGWRMNWSLGLKLGLALVGLLLAVMLLLILAALLVAPSTLNQLNQFVEPFGGLGGALGPIVMRRLQGVPVLLFLLFLIVTTVARVFPRHLGARNDQDEKIKNQSDRVVVNYPPATAFALLLVVVGAGLVLVPEFFYLRDNFSTRINTIFKFYYQAWLVFSIASAYAVYVILGDSSLRVGAVVRGAYGVLAVVAIGAGLLYPVLAVYDRMFLESGRARAENPAPLSIDGGPQLIAATDYEAIMCWQRQLNGTVPVVAEALGGAYNPAYGRVAGLTGVPIVLGWENHENQWRGATYGQVAGSRSADIPSLYSDLRWDEAQVILSRYGIDYVFYGSSERQQYGSSGEEKFIENLEPVCAVRDGQGDVVSVFYRVTDRALQTAPQS